MRTTIFTLAAGIALSLSTAALADDPQAPAPQPVAVASSDQLICHHFVHQGMLLKSNDCKTQKQWDAQRRSEERDFDTFQRRTYSAPFGK